MISTWKCKYVLWEFLLQILEYLNLQEIHFPLFPFHSDKQQKEKKSQKLTMFLLICDTLPALQRHNQWQCAPLNVQMDHFSVFRWLLCVWDGEEQLIIEVLNVDLTSKIGFPATFFSLKYIHTSKNYYYYYFIPVHEQTCDLFLLEDSQ